MSGIWLGLGAALAWRFADYLAQPASRILGAVRAVFYAQLIGLFMLLPLVLLTQKDLSRLQWAGVTLAVVKDTALLS